MEKLKISLLLLAIVLLSLNLRSENPCGIMYPVHDTTSWGIGFIRIPINNVASIIGLTAKTGKECYLVNGEIRIFGEKFPKIDPFDFVYMGGYDYMLLKVYQIKDTRLKICTRTIDGGVWVDFDELAASDFVFTTYLAFLEKNGNFINYNGKTDRRNHLNIGVNLLHSCLNLRTHPSLDSAIVVCLKNNETEGAAITHMELFEIRDGWAWVLVRESVPNVSTNDDSDGEECSFKVVNEYQGHVKVLDDAGRPNIWYAVTAY